MHLSVAYRLIACVILMNNYVPYSRLLQKSRAKISNKLKTTVRKNICFCNQLTPSFSRTGYIPPFLASNIKVMDWFPQNDLLAHKDIKAFVSHVGHNSLYESAYHGVPVVAVPFF